MSLIPTLAAAGAKFKGYGVQRKKAKARQREKERIEALPPDLAAEAKERAVLDAFASAGFRVNVEKPGG